jgi:NitT/TauT family transport system substrate-binding protein
MAMRAIEFSKQRAGEIKRVLIEKHGIEAARLDTVGRGWEEPLGPDMEKNRRVEAQWFTLE